jgi:hypothetical protein
MYQYHPDYAVPYPRVQCLHILSRLNLKYLLLEMCSSSLFGRFTSAIHELGRWVITELFWTYNAKSILASTGN